MTAMMKAAVFVEPGRIEDVTDAVDLRVVWRNNQHLFFSNFRR